MKNHLLLSAVAYLVACQSLMAQGVAVNADGSSANSSAMLDVKSTTQGVLVPRMDSAQRSIISTPATGLLVYQTDGVTPGFYFYNGSAWASLSGGAPTGAAGGNLTGTYPNPTIASLPAISGANLTSLPAGNLTGSVGTARLGTGTADTSHYLRGDGTWSNSWSNANNLTSGMVATAMLGTGTASSSTYLCGNGTWGTPAGGASITMISASTSITLTTANQFVYVTASGVTLTLPASPPTGQTIYIFTDYNTGDIDAGSNSIRQGNTSYSGTSTFSDEYLGNQCGIFLIWNGSLWFGFGYNLL